jgi:hypothetical protein
MVSSEVSSAIWENNMHEWVFQRGSKFVSSENLTKINTQRINSLHEKYAAINSWLLACCMKYACEIICMTC